MVIIGRGCRGVVICGRGFEVWLAMPLPKSASIAARATDVYSDACPLVMRFLKERKGGGEEELPLLLPYLRQLLTCCACAGLLEDPMVSLSCGHCYCYLCQFGEPLLKIHCRQCRQREGLVINSQLRVIAKLYRHLIQVLSSATPTNHTLQELIIEVTQGIKVSKAMFYILPPTRYRKLTALKPIKLKSKETVSSSDQADIIDSDIADIDIIDTDQKLSVTEDCISSDVLLSDGASHFKLMRSNKTIKKSERRYSPLQSRRHPFTPSLRTKILPIIVTPSTPPTEKTTPTVTSSKKKGKKTQLIVQYEDEEVIESIRGVKKEVKYNCRCGTNPGVMFEHLICMKKKCPCFYNELPCTRCRCKGCCNPYNKS